MVFCVPSPVLNTRNTMLNEDKEAGHYTTDENRDGAGIGCFGTPEDTPTTPTLASLIASRELDKTMHIL